ncbi:methyltransferase domain-containing protein [Cylindrospermopsis raciborskii CHAB3438]|uniref:methyltransferase domain-containing protein n=1 Tax=Cylindrospermopsis raciborskii TaxID=77022 RepID=UPI001F0D1C49|nr:methyltransferase domain-containing protein [Cylindrospermopsis raciborskii]MCH4903853.1 methyltransferase domain-containing protein [Cylindrospermopsis raciborskii CHAB3438]
MIRTLASRYIRILIVMIFSKKFLLRHFGLVAVGEQNRLLRFPVWLTLDVVGKPDYKIKVDDDFRFPFDDKSIRAIYTSHNLEHLTLEAAHSLIAEAYRILKPGGELLIDVPCAKKAFSMLCLYLENPLNISFLKYVSGLDIHRHSLEQSYKMVPENRNVPKDWVSHPFNMIINGIIACFMDPPYASSHLPVIHDPAIIEKKLKSLSMDDFFDFIFSSLPNGHRYTGGHCEAWYDDKLSALLSSYGFSTQLRFHKESRTLPPILVPDRQFSRRDQWSLKVSAIKPR